MDLRYLLAQAAPYRARLVWIALSTILGSLTTLAIPWLAGKMIGGTLTNKGADGRLVVALLVAALVVMAASNMVTALISAGTSTRILADLRERIFVHVIGLPIAFHDEGRQGDTLALMTYEIARLSQFLTATLATLPATLLTALGAVVMLFWFDPALALLVPFLVPAFYLILKIVGRQLRSLASRRQRAEAGMLASAEESLEMLPAIKAFTRESAEASRYGSIVEQVRALSFGEARIYAILGPLVGLVSALAAVLLILLASRKVATGALSPPDMFSFLLYAALLTRPVAMLANAYGQVQTARGTLARLQSVLGQQPEPGHEQPNHLARASGGIAFEDIAFTYPGRDPVLAGLSFKIEEGEIVALVGENGVGKSTLVNLLLRFYQPAEGTITLGGHDISRINLKDLRRQIGYVPQRPLLFNGSIRANIALGLDDAKDEQISAAARLSQAHDFISALPQGYDTIIGDHGVRLSGGQRQRIALARALIKDPPILILDEATSMYDLEGEAAFIEACQSALAGRTVILITHRPASLDLAERIIQIHSGGVTELSHPGILI